MNKWLTCHCAISRDCLEELNALKKDFDEMRERLMNALEYESRSKKHLVDYINYLELKMEAYKAHRCNS